MCDSLLSVKWVKCNMLIRLRRDPAWRRASPAAGMSQVLRKLADDTLARLPAAPGTVRGNNQVGQPGVEQRIAVDRGFLGQYVQPRAPQMTAAQAVEQRLFVHQPATPGVDQETAGLHRSQFGRPDHAPGGVGQWTVQGKHIDLRQQLLQGRPVRVFAPGDRADPDAHAKGAGQTRYLPTQLAVPEDSEGPAGQLADRVIKQTELAAALPVACLYRLAIGVVPGDQYQHQHQGELGYRGPHVGLAAVDSAATYSGRDTTPIVG